MNEVIIPEILKRELKEKKESKQQTLNINLEQKLDKRVFYNQNYTTNNTVNNTIQKGFFRFLLEIIFLPFIIIYKSFRYIFKKYDLVNKFQLEKQKVAKSKWVNKYIKSTHDVYNFEEIY